MKHLVLILTSILLSVTALAADQFKFTFQNEDLTKMIEAYSLATGQRFVVDPGVRGRASILGADNVNKDDAFNLLSDALATNGFAIRSEGDTMIVQPARTIARSGIEVATTLPAAKPERMVTYIIPLKYVTAEEVNRDFRFLPSKDGEMSTSGKSNSLTVTDWASNLQRIDKIIKEIDKPVDPKIAKMTDLEHKNWLKERAHPLKIGPAKHDLGTRLKEETPLEASPPPESH